MTIDEIHNDQATLRIPTIAIGRLHPDDKVYLPSGVDAAINGLYARLLASEQARLDILAATETAIRDAYTKGTQAAQNRPEEPSESPAGGNTPIEWGTR